MIKGVRILFVMVLVRGVCNKSVSHSIRCHVVHLQKSNMPVTEKQLDDLIELMDDDKNGEIDLR